MTNPMSDTMWRMFLENSPEAFTYIYNMYSQMMFTYGMCFTNDRELVKDSIHEVFVHIHNNKKNIRPEQLKFYIIRSLRNELLNAFRNEKHTVPIEDASSFQPEYSVEERFIQEEFNKSMKEKVKDMLATLTANQKEILWLRYMENMSIPQIASLLKINHQSVSNNIQRSINKLRDRYKK